MCEGEAGVGGADPWEGAARVRVEEALGFCNDRQPDCHYPFEDLGCGFEEDDDAEGARGVIGGLTRLVEHYTVCRLQRGGVVPKSPQGGEKIKDDRRVDMVYPFPHGVRVPIRASSRRGGAFGDGEPDLFFGMGGGRGAFC